MKTIKIFVASSEELDTDRIVLGNLVRRLDDIYEKRGIRIKLFEWEDYDAAFNDRRKQDEYNDYVRQSDVFIALFHKKAGQFTIEEFDVATEEFKKHVSPKIYTYCKNLKPDEVESPELIEFKKRIVEELGHYWCRYDNRESLQLHIVMQLQLVENGQADTIKVEDGNVTIDGLRIAPMDKLQFAAANEDYIKIQQELRELRDEIDEMQLELEKKQQKLEKKKAKLEKDPDDEDYQEEYQEVSEEVEKLVDRLQPKLNKYNHLKEEFAEFQNLLFNTAKRVARLQGERVTERMRRAMDAFNEGKVREANIILDEAEADARRNLEDYKQSKEITELKRQTVISSIEELLLKTSTIMADSTLPIEERIARTEKIYAQADEMAEETDYDREKYVQLLLDYAEYLQKYALYTRALQVCERLIKMCEELYGTDHEKTATSYNNIGYVFDSMGDYPKALEYYQKALAICEKVLGEEHPSTATSYNNIGYVFDSMGDYPKALEYDQKALAIREKVLGNDHPDTATSYNSIGYVFDSMGDYPKALEYYQKALAIREKVLGEEHPSTATSYNNIGYVFDSMGDYPKALEYYQKALAIRERVLGEEHPNTATSYNNIGAVFCEMGDYPKALEYYQKVIAIYEKVLGEEHPSTATVRDNIRAAHRAMGELF